VKCKGCGQENKLIKAHAIPEAFFVGLRDGRKPPKLITDTAGIFPQRSHIGVYDEGILCRECEDRFQEIDNYGQLLLLKEENEHIELIKNGTIIGWTIKEYNYDLLKRFFVSILWRAAISTHDFYSRVTLGPFEEEAKKLIWEESPGDPSQFSFVLAKFIDDEIGRTIMDPHRERWYGVNYYRFYLYGYVLYIKVDSRKTPAEFRRISANDGMILYIIGRDIFKSKEYPVLVNVAKQSKK